MHKDVSMLEHSVLLAHCGSASAVAEQLAELYPVLERLAAPFEVLLVDDGSPRDEREAMEALAHDYPRLRLLWVDPASGRAAVLSAGIAAARGNVVIGIGAGYAAAEIPRLLEQLARADLAHGRRRRSRLGRWWRALRTSPERLLLGTEVRDPDCRFWAARREALAELVLLAGMDRYLAWLVALRGYRVVEVGVCESRATWPSRTSTGKPRWGDLISVWWQRRRRQSYTVTEVLPPAVEFEALDGEEMPAREAA
jgi:glycosyltransferase involved in cell wall biosynthesis